MKSKMNNKKCCNNTNCAKKNMHNCIRYNTPTHHKNINHTCNEKHNEIFDFIIVGAGTTGSVLANRLSQNGKYTVCVLEAGRDDARVPEILPEVSSAPVAQPGDYHWGQYTRSVLLKSSLINRGFAAFHFNQKVNMDNYSRYVTNHRYSGFGGCTKHNGGISIRNSPYNWNQWVKKGLNTWSFSKINRYYKLTENRSSKNSSGDSYYGKVIENYNGSSGIPGVIGGFDSKYYGFDGQVPLIYSRSNASNEYTTVMRTIFGTTLVGAGMPYPVENMTGLAKLVDLDYPLTTSLGGLCLPTSSQTDQTGCLVPPADNFAYVAPGIEVEHANYCQSMYGDDGFRVPCEFNVLNDPKLNSTVLQPTQRVSADVYLYPAIAGPTGLCGPNMGRKNLTIKSEVFVTKIIIENWKARGVKYLEGYNIYESARNPDTVMAGYGGTRGDARYNALLAKQKKEKTIYAKKGVILCAGVYNSPQLLLLSGIGNKNDLHTLGINVKKHLPGVGKHLIDNTEIMMFWDINNPANPNFNSMIPTRTTPGFNLAASLFPRPPTIKDVPFFDIIIGAYGAQDVATADQFVQKGWGGTQNTGSVMTTNNRSRFENILIDTKYNINTHIGDDPSHTQGVVFNPIMRNFNPGSGSVMGLLVEQEDFCLSEGHVCLKSADPTDEPIIHMNYLTKQDKQNWIDLFIYQIFPMMISLYPTGYYSSLLDPAPIDILKVPKTNFTFINIKSTSTGFPIIIKTCSSHGYSTGDNIVITGVINNITANGVFNVTVTGIDTFTIQRTGTCITGIGGVVVTLEDIDKNRLADYFVRNVGGHHAGGTCKMGKSTDPYAVVNEDGSVYGITNLYVCDNSIIPVSMRWPNSSLYVIAEKIANDIINNTLKL